MCLFVQSSSVRKPIKQQSVFKLLSARGGYGSLEFCTPYQRSQIPFGDGHFVPKDAQRRSYEFYRGSAIYGGYIHSSTSSVDVYAAYAPKLLLGSRLVYSGEDVLFPAIALNVVAHGNNNDLISQGLYIPAFDLRNYTDADIRKLSRWYTDSFTEHTKTVLNKLGRPYP